MISPTPSGGRACARDRGVFLWDQRPWRAARALAIVGNPELR